LLLDIALRIRSFYLIPSVQFFDSVNTGSPIKKRKLEVDDDDEGEDQIGEDLALEHEDEDEDSMPGFHELDEADVELSQEILEEMAQSELEANDDDVFVAGPSRPRPPVSAPARTSSRSTFADDSGDDNARPSSSRASTKPRSAGPIRRLKRENDEEEGGIVGSDTHVCPVCGKTLETDNQGLNAHVDFCLSRGAILEAQAEASHAPTRAPGDSDLNGGGFQWKKKEERKGKRRKG
jgi:DNA polymerase kappa